MPGLTKSINCKDLPINPVNLYGRAKSGVVVVEGFPSQHMVVKKVDEHTVEVCLDGTKVRIDLLDPCVRIHFLPNGIVFQKHGYFSYSKAIYNVPEHKLYQLEEAKELLKSMGAVLS